MERGPHLAHVTCWPLCGCLSLFTSPSSLPPHPSSLLHPLTLPHSCLPFNSTHLHLSDNYFHYAFPYLFLFFLLLTSFIFIFLPFPLIHIVISPTSLLSHHLPLPLFFLLSYILLLHYPFNSSYISCLTLPHLISYPPPYLPPPPLLLPPP